MKDIIKKWWFWLTIFLLIIIIVLIMIFLKNDDGVGTAGISKTEFENIQLGMNQFEVNAIIDQLDEWDNDDMYEKCCEEISHTSKNSIYTYVYKYYGENQGYALVTYEVDYSEGVYGLKYPEVVEKQNYGLK